MTSMRIYRPKDSAFWGTLLIVFGLAFIGGFVALNVYLAKFVLALVIMYVLGAVIIALGIYLVIGGRHSHIVSSKGRMSIATIIDKKTWKNGYRAGRITHHSITVSYTGESGQQNECVIDDLNKDDYDALKEGTRIYCRILGESCTVDVNNIELVDD